MYVCHKANKQSTYLSNIHLYCLTDWRIITTLALKQALRLGQQLLDYNRTRVGHLAGATCCGLINTKYIGTMYTMNNTIIHWFIWPESRFLSDTELGIWSLRLCSVVENVTTSKGQYHHKNSLIMGQVCWNNLSQVKMTKKKSKTIFHCLTKHLLLSFLGFSLDALWQVDLVI